LALDEKVVRSLAVRLEAVAFDVADAHAAAAFWAGLLDREVVTEPGAALVPGDPTQVGLRFVTSERRCAGRPRLHLHVTSRSLDDQQRIVAAALRLGGRPHEVGQTGEEGFVVLADPEGNELCVIEPGNTYLAGTGDLGEVTCEGTRAVGLVWRAQPVVPLALTTVRSKPPMKAPQVMPLSLRRSPMFRPAMVI
jgi:catechol 2,3-dioxygenase-like lactoylglutathione lyase family enzyme